jgi:Mechanosensitive ion channel, conserved TM helix
VADRQGHHQGHLGGADPGRFDKAVERGGIKKALESSKYDASDILAKIVYYALMLFVLSAAFGVFGTNPVSAYLHAVVAYLPLVFVAIIIVIIASVLAAGAKALIQNSLSGLSYAKALGNVASGLILAVGLIAALDQLHVATNVVNAVLYATLAALAGVVIVAVGGGGIKAMSERWDAAASKYDQEKPRIAEAARNAPSVKDQARQAKDALSSRSSGAGSQADGVAAANGATRY